MVKGLSLYIGAETKDAVRGVGDIGDGLEALQDELGETVKDSAALERNFSSDVKDMASAAEKTGRSVGTDFKKGADQGREGFRNFKEEAIANVSEVASSFSGDLTEAVDGVQGTLGGLAAALEGPAAVAAAGAAIGVGFITQGLVDAQEEADKLAERLTSAYQSAVEGGRDVLDENQIIAASNEIIFDPAQRKQYQEDAAAIGVDASTLIRAMSGDEAALNDVLAAGVALRDAQKEKTAGMVGYQGESVAAYDSELTKLESVVGKLEQQKATVDQIKEGVALAQQLRGQDYELIQKQNKALAETPKTLPVSLVPDTSALDHALANPRSIDVLTTFVGRNGMKVF